MVHHVREFYIIVNLVLERMPGASEEEIIDAVVAEHKLEDGLTLCKRCHDAYHKDHGK